MPETHSPHTDTPTTDTPPASPTTSPDALIAHYHRRRGAQAAAALADVAARVPGLRARLESAQVTAPGTSVAQVSALELTAADLDAISVVAKDDLPALQRTDPPFGGLVAQGTQVRRIFASPGPIYEAQGAGSDPWHFAAALAACGIGANDIVLNCFGYHLSPAGMMFDLACHEVGATVIPAGVGALEVQAAVVADLGVTAFIGLPSYLAALVETFDQAGLDAQRWRIDKALVTAEPLPEDLRQRLMTRVPTVLMAYGTAEAGLIAHEVSAGTGLVVPEHVLVQICDPQTGQPLADESPGEVVVTTIGEPLVRFGTGDVSRWQVVDGELRLAGVLGRVGAAVKVRGLFIHPHQAAEVIRGLEGVSAGRYLVERTGDRDELVLEVVLDHGGDVESLTAAAVERSRAVLRVRPSVRVVADVPAGARLVDLRTPTTD